MEAPHFEIRVAIIGFVSVGKSTLLNAILRDKYSEVAMRRTTAGANFFRLSGYQGSNHDPEGKEKKCALETYSEIKKDNEELRQVDGVHEKFFDIALDEPLLEMRNDTRLVLIDIPGIDEAGSGAKYSSYVNEHWHEFDCVIVIVDATKGVNSEDQLRLLKMTKQNLDRSKKIPVIIVGNKVDDADDDELHILVKELEHEVEKTFGIDTIHAFIYRSAASLTLEQFQRFDPGLVNRLGREEIGRQKWKQLTDDEKTKAVYDIVSDPARSKEGQAVSNWKNFIYLLTLFIGGRERQSQLIADQVAASLRHLSPNKSLADQLRPLYSKCTSLGISFGSIKDSFWEKIGRVQDNPVLLQPATPTHNKKLASVMSQLLDYGIMCVELAWKEEVQRVELHMKHFVRLFLKNLMNSSIAFLDRPAPSAPINILEWILICQSILAAFYDEDVVEAFGRERLMIASLETKMKNCVVYGKLARAIWIMFWSFCALQIAWRHLFDRPVPLSEVFCMASLAFATFRFLEHRVPGFKPPAHAVFHHNKDDAKLTVRTEKGFCRVSIPESLSDPNHFGHMLWLFRNFKQAIAQHGD